MLAGGDASEGEQDDGVLTLVVGSPKELVPRGGSEKAELDAGAKDAAADMGERATSHKDITKD